MVRKETILLALHCIYTTPATLLPLRAPASRSPTECSRNPLTARRWTMCMYMHEPVLCVDTSEVQKVFVVDVRCDTPHHHPPLGQKHPPPFLSLEILPDNTSARPLGIAADSWSVMCATGQMNLITSLSLKFWRFSACPPELPAFRSIIRYTIIFRPTPGGWRLRFLNSESDKRAGAEGRRGAESTVIDESLQQVSKSSHLPF